MDKQRVRSLQKKLLQECVDIEKNYSVKQFGEFNSAHEGIAVLWEEIQELEEEFNTIKAQVKTMWRLIKTNENLNDTIHIMGSYTDYLLLEAVQVRAMVEKMKNLLDYKGEN